MANIRLKELVEANVDPKLVARSKETGKLVYFKTPQTKAAAMKAGTHLDPKAKKGDEPKADAKPNDMFGKDYKKDRGAETPKADKTKAASPNADVKSIIKGILKTADKEFRGAYKLKDVASDFNIDDSDADGKELKARLDKGEDGTYVQTDETVGTVVFNDGSQYEFAHVEDGPIPVMKVGPGPDDYYDLEDEDGNWDWGYGEDGDFEDEDGHQRGRAEESTKLTSMIKKTKK